MKTNASQTWYPCGLTPLKDVKILLPNHFIDLKSWKAARHWPKEAIRRISGSRNIRKTVDEITHIITSVIETIAAYQPLHISLSAGKDTRTLLACSRNVLDKVIFYTTKRQPDAPDTIIPPMLAKLYNLNHVMNRQFDPDRIVLLGFGGEAGRGYLWPGNYYYNKFCKDVKSAKGHMSAEEALARMLHPATKKEFFLDEIRNWLTDISQFDPYLIANLLYVEQHLGCLISQVMYNEYDVRAGKFSLYPMNHRRMFELMFSLPIDYVEKDRLPEDVCKVAWPELLEIPFNAHHFEGRVKYKKLLKYLYKSITETPTQENKEKRQLIKKMITGNRSIMKMVRDDIAKAMNKPSRLFNKPLFLYKYHIKLPLTREMHLFNTIRKLKKIMGEIVKHKDIPKLSKEFTTKHNINIHILCSHASLESCFLSLATFYFFSKEYAEIVIHEDGTFTKKDEEFIKKIFPWVKYVSLKDADARLKSKNFSPETIASRHKHKLLIKTIDFHHIESRDRILIIDTDIFLLGGMQELWSKIIEGAQLVFNDDLEPAYGSSKDLLEKVLMRQINIDPKPCINTGLIVEPAQLLRGEKRTIECYCKELASFPYERIHCVEQGYIACILKDKRIEENPLSRKHKIIGHRDTEGIEGLKNYDFIKNQDSLETIHLCGWDKLERNFQAVKREILHLLICKKRRAEIAFYPNTVLDWLDPSWRMIKEALCKRGVEVIKMKLSFLSLLNNRKKIKCIHFHYVYPDISRDNYKYLPAKIWNRASLLIAWFQKRTFKSKLKIAKLLGYKIVYTAHNLDFHEEADCAATKNKDLLYKMADSITIMGHDIKGKLAEFIAKKKVKYIPICDFKKSYKNYVTKEIAREKLGIPAEAFVFLFFGSIRRYKGIDTLVNIFKKIQIDALLLIAGDISHDPIYVKEIQSLVGHSTNIMFANEIIPDDAVQFYMNASDVVVFPFRRIYNSGSLILAKSFFKPTICMDRGNVRNYVNPNTDILVKGEKELEKALIETRHRVFPKTKEEYLKGIPSPEEVAGMYKSVYDEL